MKAKKLRRILIVLIVFCMLSACGKKADENVNTENTDTSAADDTVSMKQEDTQSVDAPAGDDTKTESASDTENVSDKQDGNKSDSLFSSNHEKEPSPDWVNALAAAKDDSVTQLFVVAGMGMDKTTATVTMHEKNEAGEWEQVLSTPAYVGKNGLCLDKDHKEGCGQTPIGTYHFNKAFGIADDPGCAIPYVKVDEDTYWSGDTRDGMHYNEMVNINDYPDLDMTDSEHIIDCSYEYQYCLNISFNEDGTAGRGSAIFLHCFGSWKTYTGGCVALPENIMKIVMQTVKPDCTVVIDTMDHLTRAQETESAAAEESDVNLSDDATDFVMLSEAVPDAVLEIRYGYLPTHG
ncbi:MAG: hypothetical protein IK078_00025 [Lachnospiraceae bacterium]|nr:hypothetical protein [Lachnospiraceae bacterium]